MSRSFFLTLLLSLVAKTAFCGSFDLLTAWEHARNYDAQVRVAEADNHMQQEEVAKARAALRPNIQAMTSRGRNMTSSTALPETRYYNTESSSFTLKQTIFNRSNGASYRQAKAVARKSDHVFRNEVNDLMVRTVEAYFNLLYSEDNLELQKAAVEASAEKLEQEKHALQSGLGTVTAIDEAQANYDMALAEEFKALNTLDFNRREMERLTGLYPEKVAKLSEQAFIPQKPVPGNVESWIVLALEKSPEINSAEQGMEIARRELQKNRGARYPALDLIAGRSYTLSETNYTIDKAYDTYSLQLQLKVPVYTGGYVSAAVRQAKAGYIKAEEEYSWNERQVVSDIRKYFDAVINSLSQITAFEKAVASRHTALKSARKGIHAGLSTKVDVLQANARLLAARQELSKARYQYILNLLMLKDTAGHISADDIRSVNNWLHTM